MPDRAPHASSRQPSAPARRPAPPARAAARSARPARPPGPGRGRLDPAARARRASIAPCRAAGCAAAACTSCAARRARPRRSASPWRCSAGCWRGHGHAVWIGPRDDLFAPGLAALGLAPERLILVRARGARRRPLGARGGACAALGLGAALAEVDRLSLTQSRRLQLAAEAQGVTAFAAAAAGRAGRRDAAERRHDALADHRFAEPGPGAHLGPPRWRVELVRCRGGRTGVWQVAWREGGLA